MGKNTITKTDKLDLEAIAHNAAMDAGKVAEDVALIHAVNTVIEAQEGEQKSRETKRQSIGHLFIMCGEQGITKDQLKALFTSHPSWPKENTPPVPVSENKARKTFAGDAWNSVSVSWGRYVIENGAPKVETVEGQKALVKTGAQKHETFGAGSPKVEEPQQPTFDVLSIIAHIADKLTPAEFDAIRPELEAIAKQFNQTVQTVKLAA